MKIIFCENEGEARGIINEAIQKLSTIDCDISINYTPKHIDISNIKNSKDFDEDHYFFELRVSNIKKNLLNKSKLFEGNDNIYFVFKVIKDKINENNLIVILSGTPASGKDTISKKILNMYPDKFKILKKHKITKTSEDYIPVAEVLFKEKILNGDFLEHHSRYNSSYGADKYEVDKILKDGFIPIIHNGNVRYIYNFLKNSEYSFLNIYLDCNEKNAIERLKLRNDSNMSDRLEAYKEERYDYLKFIQNSKNKPFDLIVNTNVLCPEESALSIHCKITRR